MAEKNQAHYVLMACGHHVPKDDPYSNSFRARGAPRWWCEECGDWKNMQTVSKKEKVPGNDEPLF